MAPPAGRRVGDDFVDDSDSDVSITGLDDETSRAKAKGKGKAIDRNKKDKGKAKAKEASRHSPLLLHVETEVRGVQQPYAWEASYSRSWDTVQEDERGRLEGAVQDWIARGRRRRCAHEITDIRRR